MEIQELHEVKRHKLKRDRDRNWDRQTAKVFFAWRETRGYFFGVIWSKKRFLEGRKRGILKCVYVGQY